MESFTTHLSHAKAKLGINFDLKNEQVQALESIYNSQDTLCLLRTGFGKSVIYQATPFLLEHRVKDAVTLVISPLNSIMQDQVLKLSQQGVKACYLDMRCMNGESYRWESKEEAKKKKQPKEDSDASGDESDDEAHNSQDSDTEEDPDLLKVSVPVNKILSGGYKIIYAHPEAFLSSTHGKALIRNPEFRRRVCCVAIDEAHMIAEWGEKFRQDFSRLNDLIALCGGAPTLVLTATASSATKAHIIRELGLRDPVCISVHPDRPNITYQKKKRSPAAEQKDDLDNILYTIAKGLMEQEREYPITIMYTSLENIGYSFQYLKKALKNAEYVGERVSENRLFGMYHQGTSQRMKSHIVSELGSNRSRKRFVLATVALGMGLDAPAIRKVIHFGSPTSIEKYLQETGRAGRDGQPSEAILYFNACDIRKNRPGQTISMADFCRSDDQCLRQMLLQYLDFHAPEDRIPCQCCMVCKGRCTCAECVG